MRMAKNSLPRATLARNLSYLMDKHQLSCAALAKRSGVSAKTINNMTNTRYNVTLDSVDAVARAFGLSGWHLIMPNLPADLIESRSLENLVTRYAGLPAEGRDQVERTADREAEYFARKPAG